MKKTQSNLVLKSSLAPPRLTSLAIDISPFISNNNKRSHYSALFLKILSAFIIGLFLFTSCKKDDFLPAPPEASQNNDILKASGMTYYVDLSGNDVTGNGSAGAPWKSLYKACQSVTVSGSVIHINAGTYIEARQCNLSVGVSIQGAGSTQTIINCTYSFSVLPSGDFSKASIVLSSATNNTNGNQSISNLTLDGGWQIGSTNTTTATRAVLIRGRGNVTLNGVSIKNFWVNGIGLYPVGSIFAQPATRPDGNVIMNSQIRNCGNGYWTYGGAYEGAACVEVYGQANLLFHHNTVMNIDRYDRNSDLMARFDFSVGVKIYNNEFWKNELNGPNNLWNFGIETWNIQGGLEIYDNNFHGGYIPIDLGGPINTKGTYDYSAKIYRNNIVRATAIDASKGTATAIHLESSKEISDVFIYDNYIENFAQALTLSDGAVGVTSHKRRIYFYNNLAVNCQWAQTWTMHVVGISNNYGTASTISDLHIENNTFIGKSGKSIYGIDIFGIGTLSNIFVKNNIFYSLNNANSRGFVHIPETKGGYTTGARSNFHIENNLSYLCGNNNAISSGGTIGSYTYTNQVKANPLFVSGTNFHLQSISPARNAGSNVGLPYLESGPDIGAFEYSSGVVPPTVSNLAPIIQNQSFQLNANSSINTTVGKIIASDPDAGQTLFYSILSGNTSGAFAINASTGALTVANSAALNFSTTPSFSLTVKAQDNGSGPLSKLATVSVGLINVSSGSASGKITYQKWNNLGSSALVSALTGNINYPNKPSSTIQITSMEAASGQGDSFGSRISGYIYAPVSGSYTFWIASDNNGELWLSTNDQPASKKRIAYHTSATGSREWNKYTTQKSVKINMVKGQKYYIEALMKEAYGGDNLAVGWLKPGQSGSVPLQIIPGSVLSPR